MWSRKISSRPISIDRQQRIALERVRVPVEGVGPEKHQQVAGDVDDEIQEEREAGDADEQLRADRGRRRRADRDDIETLSCTVPQSRVRIAARTLTLAQRVSIRSFAVAMKIHEYQAKAILARHGVPVPRGEVAFNAAEARRRSPRRLGGGVVVVKAQIHAGGRGKGGGVKLAQVARRSRDARARHDRHDARHASDRPGGPRRRARARRRRPADDARAVSEHRARSRGRQAGHDGQRRRRHGHRRSRREDAREDRQGLHRAGRRPRAVRGAAARVRARPRRRRRSTRPSS